MKILNHLLALAVAILVSAGAAHAQRTLKVAYTPFNVPIVFAEGATAENYRKLDPKADVARGAFIDLMKAVAGDAGLSIEFVPLVAGDHGAALLKGDIDILTAGARTPELDAAAVFSGPTYTYAEGLVVKNGDARPYRTYEDLRGEVVGAQRGTPSAVALQKIGIFAALKLYESGAELEQAVGDGARPVSTAASMVRLPASSRTNPPDGTSSHPTSRHGSSGQPSEPGRPTKPS